MMFGTATKQAEQVAATLDPDFWTARSLLDGSKKILINKQAGVESIRFANPEQAKIIKELTMSEVTPEKIKLDIDSYKEKAGLTVIIDEKSLSVAKRLKSSISALRVLTTNTIEDEFRKKKTAYDDSRAKTAELKADYDGIQKKRKTLLDAIGGAYDTVRDKIKEYQQVIEDKKLEEEREAEKKRMDQEKADKDKIEAEEKAVQDKKEAEEKAAQVELDRIAAELAQKEADLEKERKAAQPLIDTTAREVTPPLTPDQVENSYTSDGREGEARQKVQKLTDETNEVFNPGGQEKIPPNNSYMLPVNTETLNKTLPPEVLQDGQNEAVTDPTKPEYPEGIQVEITNLVEFCYAIVRGDRGASEKLIQVNMEEITRIAKENNCKPGDEILDGVRMV